MRAALILALALLTWPANAGPLFAPVFEGKWAASAAICADNIGVGRIEIGDFGRFSLDMTGKKIECEAFTIEGDSIALVSAFCSSGLGPSTKQSLEFALHDANRMLASFDGGHGIEMHRCGAQIKPLGLLGVDLFPDLPASKPHPLRFCHPDGLWDIYVTNSHSARIRQGYNQRSDCRMGGPHRYPELSQAMMQKIACDNGFEALVEIDPEDRMLIFFKEGGYIILSKCD